jgi:hypothetical protein
MKVTWKFLAGLAAGFFLVLGVMWIAFRLNLGVWSETSRWAYELNRRKKLITEQTPEPHLLIVGGSATLFGISAKQIEEATGCHTVNLGTHAALGTAAILHVAEQDAKPGDTVLLALEYELYINGKVKQPWAHSLIVDYLVARDPAFLRTLSLSERWTVFMLTPVGRLIDGIKHRFRAEPPYEDAGLGAYSVRNLDPWGDLTHHTRDLSQANREGVLRLNMVLIRGLPANAEGFETIAAFRKWAETNHVRVLATFPNMCDHEEYREPASKKSIQTIKEFYASLNVPIVGDYTNALLPADSFFDTMYHLTDDGTRVRTQTLIPFLKQALANSAATRPPAATSPVPTLPSNSATGNAP